MEETKTTNRDKLQVIGQAIPFVLMFVVIIFAYYQNLDNEQSRREREQTAAYLNTIEHLEEARVITDHIGLIREWNDQMEVMFGWSRSETLGKNPDFLMSETMARFHNAHLESAMKDPDYGYVHEIICPEARHKDGRQMEVKVKVRIEKRENEPVAIATFTQLDKLQVIDLTSLLTR